jgi:hypothetical protein
MPEVVIRLSVPEGCSVRVEGAQASTTGRGNGRGGSSTRSDNGSQRGSEGASGSASEKQRKLVYARARAADVPLEVVLDHLGIPSLDQLDWQMIDGALEFLEGGGQQAEAPADVTNDDIPF